MASIRDTDGRASTEMEARAARALAALAARQPLIHHLTNAVVANDVANLTLGFGARPVMADAPEEAAEIASAARALVLNLGMPSPTKIEAMTIAGKTAAARGIPIVLDPVGAGATALRTETALRLLAALPITVLRGNRGEIGALIGAGMVSGVDALGAEDPEATAREAAARFGTVVAVTGRVDVVVGPNGAYAVQNGHALLPRITGSGCMASAAIGILLTAGGEPTLHAALALGVYGLAAERAARGAPGPGSFRARLHDEIAALHVEGTAGLRITAAECADDSPVIAEGGRA